MTRRTVATLVSIAGALLFGGFLLTRQSMPVYAQETDLFINPQPIAIAGYNGSAMEPFISSDGRYLFFNTDDDTKTDTKAIHFAERTGLLSFRYRGPLGGAKPQAGKGTEAGPSLDAQGRFYFTSPRQYHQDRQTVFVGQFNGNSITSVQPVRGDISPTEHGRVNMDASISRDGNTLYLSRARFGGMLTLLFSAPSESNLLVARRSGDRFQLDPNGAQIMKNVNTGYEYAAEISANGLELYFNRGTRLMVATRTSPGGQFGEPRLLRAITGFVEGPTLSNDGQELFFHRKNGDVCCTILRATRAR